MAYLSPLEVLQIFKFIAVKEIYAVNNTHAYRGNYYGSLRKYQRIFIKWQKIPNNVKIS